MEGNRPKRYLEPAKAHEHSLRWERSAIAVVLVSPPNRFS